MENQILRQCWKCNGSGCCPCEAECAALCGYCSGAGTLPEPRSEFQINPEDCMFYGTVSNAELIEIPF